MSQKGDSSEGEKWNEMTLCRGKMRDGRMSDRQRERRTTEVQTWWEMYAPMSDSFPPGEKIKQASLEVRTVRSPS